MVVQITVNQSANTHRRRPCLLQVHKIKHVEQELFLHQLQYNHQHQAYQARLKGVAQQAGHRKLFTKFKKHFSDTHRSWKLTQMTRGAGFNPENAEQGDVWKQEVQETDLLMDDLVPAFVNIYKATAFYWQVLGKPCSGAGARPCGSFPTEGGAYGE